MPTVRTIAILGACSKNGTTAGRKLTSYNNLLLVDEDKDGLSKLKSELVSIPGAHDVDIMECFQDTGWESDAVVLAMQTTKDKEAFGLMKPYLTGKTVIVFSCGKEDDLDMLLPHSNVVRINEADLECINKMQSILNENL
jgi:ketopantoate reductase